MVGANHGWTSGPGLLDLKIFPCGSILTPHIGPLPKGNIPVGPIKLGMGIIPGITGMSMGVELIGPGGGALGGFGFG